jgi:hypothetical protein
MLTVVELVFLAGATLKPYSSVSSVSTSFSRKLPEDVEAVTMNHQTPGLTFHRLAGHYGHTRDLGRKVLMAPRVPARLPAFRPPRGKMNFTGGSQRSQIESCTHPAYRF